MKRSGSSPLLQVGSCEVSSPIAHNRSVGENGKRAFATAKLWKTQQ